MSDLPLVSIIMPAFNAARYIGQAIKSVIEQTHPFWELIIVNDGSTDETESRALGFSDTRIRYFVKENGGVPSARNLGLRHMRGEYFIFLDADDVLPPESLRCRIEKFRTQPGLDFVDGIVEIADESLTQVIRKYEPRFSGHPLALLLQLSDRCFFGPSWMVKRRDETYHMAEHLTHGEDYLFYASLSRGGGLYDFVEEPVLYYRQHMRSAMRDLEGLHRGYREIYRELKRWPEFSIRQRLAYHFRMRKSMFLSYAASRQYRKAVEALVT